MILKGPISFNKKLIAPYIYRFNAALAAYLAVAIVTFLAAGIPIGVYLGDYAEMYFCLAFLAVYLAGVVVFFVIAMRLRERLVDERTAELEAEFVDMPLEEATAILKQKGIITDGGFVADDDVFGGKVMPFDKLRCFVYSHSFEFKPRGHMLTLKRTSDVKVFLQVYGTEDAAKGFAEDYQLDCALFNFVDKRNLIDYESNREFVLLKTDKKNFVRSAFGFKLK